MSELLPGEGGLELPGVSPAPLLPSPPAPPIDLPAPPKPKPPPSPAPVPAPEPAPAPKPPVVPVPGPSPSPAPEPPIELPGDGDTGAVPGLSDLARLLVILGLILLAAVLADVLNTIIRTILGPLWSRTGRKTVTPQQLTQWVSNPLGNAFQGIDAELGHAFEQLAGETGRVGSAILGAEQRLYKLATTVAGHSASLKRQGAAGAAASAKATGAAAVAAEALTAAHGASRAASAAEQALEQRLEALSEHVTRVLEPELEALRHRVPELERGATVTWDTLKQHSEALGIAGVTAATAAALGRLGGSWIRCETNQLLGRALCGSDSNLIRKLLGDALDALALADLCELAELVMDAGEAMVPLLEGFVDVEMALIGCHGFDRPPALPVPALSMTPVLEPIAL